MRTNPKNKKGKNKTPTKLFKPISGYVFRPDGTYERRTYDTLQDFLMGRASKVEIAGEWKCVEEAGSDPMGKLAVRTALPVSRHRAKRGKKH